MPQPSFVQKLDQVSRVLPIKHILARKTSDTRQIARYYRKNRLAYHIFNSHDGFVHMGLSNDGSFRKADFYAHAKIVQEVISSIGATRVLELAPGKAATIRYLAKLHPDTEFYGIDLPGGQLKTRSGYKNVYLIHGDFHNLADYADESMDVVYVIEALCHSPDKNRVISQIRRVLRPGGQLIVIDGYFSRNPAKLTDDQKLAVNLVASSMMVTSNHQDYKGFVKILEANGFRINQSVDYSKNIMPSLLRLEATAKRYFKHPRVAKVITAVTGDLVTANAAAGYLMADCVKAGLFEYRYTLATKNK